MASTLEHYRFSSAIARLPDQKFNPAKVRFLLVYPDKDLTVRVLYGTEHRPNIGRLVSPPAILPLVLPRIYLAFTSHKVDFLYALP